MKAMKNQDGCERNCKRLEQEKVNITFNIEEFEKCASYLNRCIENGITIKNPKYVKELLSEEKNMMTEEEYAKTLIEMWDSLRTEHKGKHGCIDVPCACCPLRKFVGCNHAQDIFDIYNTVERWAKEHQPKKFKVSKLEYDILYNALDFSSNDDTFDDIDILHGLLENGYFNGATNGMCIREYFENCKIEVDA